MKILLSLTLLIASLAANGQIYYDRYRENMQLPGMVVLRNFEHEICTALDLARVNMGNGTTSYELWQGTTIDVNGVACYQISEAMWRDCLRTVWGKGSIDEKAHVMGELMWSIISNASHCYYRTLSSVRQDEARLVGTAAGIMQEPPQPSAVTPTQPVAPRPAPREPSAAKYTPPAQETTTTQPDAEATKGESEKSDDSEPDGATILLACVALWFGGRWLYKRAAVKDGDAHE